MRFERLCLATIFALFVLPAIACAEDPYVQQEDVVFGESHGMALVMDIFTPTGEKNGLAIVDVASGAWHSDRGKINDHKRAQMYDIFCGRGYTVFAVRPGSITKFSVPEMISHIKHGIEWIKDRADEFGIDPDRLGIAGASAGGHLASLTALTVKDDNPGGNAIAAAAIFFPPTDFLDYGGNTWDVRGDDRRGRMLRQLAFAGQIDGLSDQEIQQKIIDISPARRVHENAPPFLVIHGDADTVVPLQQSEILVKALEDAGVPSALIVKEGGGHPWLTIHEEVKVMADWFDERLAAK